MNDKEKFLLDRLKESLDSNKKEKEEFLLNQLQVYNQKFPRVENSKTRRKI